MRIRFSRFFNPKNATFYVFLKSHVKKRRSVFQVFTFLHYEIANGHFRCQTITHMLYIHFWLKYNGLAIVRKTTKLIEGGHRGLQDIRYYFYVFYVFFSKSKSRDFYVFCRVLYVFSNYEGYLDIPHRIKE